MDACKRHAAVSTFEWCPGAFDQSPYTLMVSRTGNTRSSLPTSRLTSEESSPQRQLQSTNGTPATRPVALRNATSAPQSRIPLPQPQDATRSAVLQQNEQSFDALQIPPNVATRTVSLVRGFVLRDLVDLNILFPDIDPRVAGQRSSNRALAWEFLVNHVIRHGLSSRLGIRSAMRRVFPGVTVRTSHQLGRQGRVDGAVALAQLFPKLPRVLAILQSEQQAMSHPSLRREVLRLQQLQQQSQVKPSTPTADLAGQLSVAPVSKQEHSTATSPGPQDVALQMVQDESARAKNGLLNTNLHPRRQDEVQQELDNPILGAPVLPLQPHPQLVQLLQPVQPPVPQAVDKRDDDAEQGGPQIDTAQGRRERSVDKSSNEELIADLITQLEDRFAKDSDSGGNLPDWLYR